MITIHWGWIAASIGAAWVLGIGATVAALGLCVTGRD